MAESDEQQENAPASESDAARNWSELSGGDWAKLLEEQPELRA